MPRNRRLTPIASRIVYWTLLVQPLLWTSARAAPSDFADSVQPIFEEKCVRCHGPSQESGGLRLDRKARALAGGSSGPVIIPGDSHNSPLIQLVAATGDEKTMPPDGERLHAAEIQALRNWIDAGAPWPDEADPEEPMHWAFQPPSRPSLPYVKSDTWAHNPVDRFILATLETKGLTPSPEADRITLLRRLKLDLHGLPPTPEEAERFLSDSSEDAYEKLLDRLLNSPHYGERWAQHWLDTIGFAETAGFETNIPRPNAWHYRDYIIGSFNRDTPYPRFIAEQLAGDLLNVDEATGFIVAGPYDNVKSPDINLTLQQRMDELHRMVSTTGSVFLGVTTGCARCHHHKFDPISQREYYALQAVFAGVQHGDREKRTPESEQRERQAAHVQNLLSALDGALAEYQPLANPKPQANTAPKRPPVKARYNAERFAPVDAKIVRFTILDATPAAPCIDEIEIWTHGPHSRNVALASLGANATASSGLPSSDIHRIEHINDGQYGNSRSWIPAATGTSWIQLTLPQTETIDRITWSRDRAGGFTDRIAVRYQIEAAKAAGQWKLVASAADRAAFNPRSVTQPVYIGATLTERDREEAARLLYRKRELEERKQELRQKNLIYAGSFQKPKVTHLLYRGDPMQKGEVVNPGGIVAFGDTLQLPVGIADPSRRLALARWIGRAENPLTARVMVNRIWQHHFGEGIVATPSDFGRMGAPPTHPALLDWLAMEFMENGWRMKPIHRMICLSNTYRQSSLPHERGQEIDAGVRLLWRYPHRRLDAEALHDAVLIVSGKLDRTMGGPGFSIFKPNDNYVRVYDPKEKFGPGDWRRMVYQSRVRMEVGNTFGVFDSPDGGQTAPKRNRSTTPMQALSLFNSGFVSQQAALFAVRVQREAGSDPSAFARRAFRLAFTREPEAIEIAAAVPFIQEHGATAFCRALLNTNEFAFIH